MEKELVAFVKEQELSPFTTTRSSSRSQNNTIFKTVDARAIHTKVLSNIAKQYIFSDTSLLWMCFPFTNEEKIILNRQEFFRSVKASFCSDLQLLTIPQTRWRPPYSMVVVTEDETTFLELQRQGCPAQFIISDQDVRNLENYDVVQVIDCDQYRMALEQLPQSVFLNSIDEAYLERYVVSLSGWVNNIRILEKHQLHPELDNIVKSLSSLIPLTEKKATQTLNREVLQIKLEEMNREISQNLKNMTISGEVLVSMLTKEALPSALQEIVQKEIMKTDIPEHLFRISVPLAFDEQEVERYIKKQQSEVSTSLAEHIKRHASTLQKIPEYLGELNNWLVVYDFLQGTTKFIQERGQEYPQIGKSVQFTQSKNIFIDQAQAISFELTQQHRCSILTGANSGGKTTLLEHFLQLVSLTQLGLPVSGNVVMPVFSEIYYFAKNKGSMNKGAFETLLTQLSSIQSGDNTLILADEIEAVTEPGVAGLVVCATVKYFLERGSYLVIATHLGQEIQSILPEGARIDGIEAKGLDENFELIVDHNPVLGRLAHSTPELIIERLANTSQKEYFTYLHQYLRQTPRELTL